MPVYNVDDISTPNLVMSPLVYGTRSTI